MRTGYAIIFFCFALGPATCTQLTVADVYIGHDFLSGFNWDTLDDPTHGRVNFVDQSTALESNLTFGTFPYLAHRF
jgi:hypothetical protein